MEEKSQGISVDSTNDRNNCTTKKGQLESDWKTDWLNNLQIINVSVMYLVFGDNFGGKQDECLETDKFGQTAHSLFRRGREFQQQQQAIWIL